VPAQIVAQRRKSARAGARHLWQTDRIQLSLVLLVKRLAVTLLEAVGLIGMHDT
jgi:hypothetical protein